MDSNNSLFSLFPMQAELIVGVVVLALEMVDSAQLVPADARQPAMPASR